MRATKFEFEQRFWIFGLLFGVAFALYSLDPTICAVAVLQWLAPSLNPDRPRGEFWLHIVFGIGALLVFLAAALRTWATAYLRTEVVHDMAQHSESVVADGPYRHLRNPLYFANIPMAIGFGLMASRTGFFVLVFGMWFFDYRLILREEHGFANDASYQRYKQSVPRLWPSLRPRVPPSGAQPHWSQAFAGESLFWLFGVAVLAFALTLTMKVAGPVLALSFVVYFICIAIVKRRTRRPTRSV